MNNENTSNPEGEARAGTLVVSNRGKQTAEILAKALGRDQTPATPQATALEASRMVRRGKFFLSYEEQTRNGSVSRPIFVYWGHGVVVGETVPDETLEGMWCFAAHNDFDLVPEFMAPSQWPEYVRTQTGWERRDALKKLAGEGLTYLTLVEKVKRLL